jgi:hypothetical protein
MKTKTTLQRAPDIESIIRTLRGQKVILDADLALIYGVETRVLNQAVKRNIDRFPQDFVFQVTADEVADVHRLRSQIVIFNWLPYHQEVTG